MTLKNAANKWNGNTILSYIFVTIILMVPFEHKYERFFKKLSKYFTNSNIGVDYVFDKKIYIFASELFIIIISIFVAYKFRVSLKKYLFSGPVKYMSLFFIIAAMSLFNSHTGNYGLQVINLMHVLVVSLFVASLYYFVKKIENRDSFIKKIFGGIVIVGLFQSFVAISQFILQKSIGLKLIGEATIGSTVPNSCSFHMSREMLSKTFLSNIIFASDNNILIRACGTFVHPNILGGFLLISIIATCYLYYHANKLHYRIGAIVVVFIQMIALFVTFSRSAGFGLIIAFSVWFGLLFCKNIDKSPYLMKKVAKLAFILLFAFSLITAMLIPLIISRGGVVGHNDSSRGGDSERVYYQKLGWYMIKTHPLLGVGFENSNLKITDYMKKEGRVIKPSFIHNIYIMVAAEVGIIGAICFTTFFVMALIKSFFRRKMTVEAISLFAMLVGFMFIGGCDYYFLHFQAGRIMLFTIATLLSVYAYTKTDEDKVFISKPSHLKAFPS
jgi:O-antigen ligase